MRPITDVMKEEFDRSSDVMSSPCSSSSMGPANR
jgi:hypothetical protein